MKNIQGVTLLLAIFISCNMNGQLWKQYTDSAKAYSIQKNADKAIEFYNKAIDELKKDSLGTISYAQICDSLGISFYRKRQYNEAEKFYVEAKQIQEKTLGREHPDYASTCNLLGIIYMQLSQYEKAEPLLLEAKQIREKLLGKEHPDCATSYNSLGRLFMFMGEYEKAEPLFLEAKRIREKVLGKKHPDYASSCNILAILYKEMGEYEKAEPLYIESKQIREKLLGKEHPEYAGSCNNLGGLYQDMGQYAKAEPLVREAKQIIEFFFGKEYPEYARYCGNLAGLYKSMGQYEKAQALYLEGKQIMEKILGKEHPDYAASCNNLGNIYRNIGQYQKAEVLYVEGKQIREKVLGKEHPEYAQSCNNLAALYQDMGQYENAEQLMLEAKRIDEKVLGKEHPHYAGDCIGLAVLYQDMNQNNKAEQLLLEAKQIDEKVLGKEHPDYAFDCIGLAVLYTNIGQYDKAELLYLEAKQIDEKVLGQEHPNYAASLNYLAALYTNIGQYDKAEPLYLKSKQIRAKVLGKMHVDYGLSCEDMANLYWVLHQPLRAEKEFKQSFSIKAYNLFSVFQFTNEKEKTAFIKNISGEDGIAYSFYASEKLKSEQPYSLSLFHRNLILSSSEALTRQLFSANDTSLVNKYDEWTNLKKYLSVLYSKPVDERKDDVAKIEEKAGQLEKELNRLSSFKSQQQKQSITWQTIQKNLKANEAAIEFAEFQYYNGKRYTDSTYYIAVVLRKDKPQPELVSLFEKRQLDSLFKGAASNNERINSIYTRGLRIRKDSSASRSAYNIIWKPLENKLKGITKIYFAPAGLLHRIAFTALPIDRTHVLSDKYQLIQLATTASVTDQKTDIVKVSDKIYLYGGVQYTVDSTVLKQAVKKYQSVSQTSRSLPDDLSRSNGFQYLPGTEREIKEIEKTGKYKGFSLRVYDSVAASEESIKALNGKSSPEVLHIATHGFFFPDPQKEKPDNMSKEFSGGKVFKQSDNPLFRSALLFAGANSAWNGEPVEGVEDGILTAYEVSNLYLPNIKLVVLSACETGLGDIQGSEGVYGLQRAFKMAGVKNLVMSLWKVPDMETSEFMKEFYKNLFAKQNISNAFYNAQNIMKKKYRSNPYKWAAWVLVR